MTSLVINVVGLPAPQGSKKGFYNARIGRVQMVESSKKVKPWRTDVQAAAFDAIGDNWTPLVGPVELAITFFMPRPAAHYRTGAHAGVLKPTAPVLVDKRPDASKLVRSTEDALTEAGVYRDDAQVARLVVEKRYADAATGARITITPLNTSLSGYNSPLYDSLYYGWHRLELSAWTGNGIRDGATKTDGDRVEVLWSNRPLGEAHLFDLLDGEPA